MEQNIKDQLISLFEAHFKEEVTLIQPLPASGSYREYARLKSMHHNVMGAYNHDVKENKAFFEFSAHFLKREIPVPHIYSISADQMSYLQEDLGNTTLFDFLTKVGDTEGFSEKIVEEYKKVLRQLPRIQLVAGKDIDYSVCYPREAFDKQSMMWDLNYFKYYFLKLAKIPFEEQALEDDFQLFSDYLLEAENNAFLYRDFQSRNIMLKDRQVYFIDYQGGRKGALQYDLASLLYDAKANIPEQEREDLLEFYLDELSQYKDVDRQKFKSYFDGYVLIRIMQAMGAYGFRGFFEKKEHFLKSIPFALKNLETLLAKHTIEVKLPELFKVLRAIGESSFLKSISSDNDRLTVLVSSFSYKKGIPKDHSGNGGGFVFDCRAIHNPGRYVEYKYLTGKSPEVQQFLEEKSTIAEFMASVISLVSNSVEVYLDRGFTNLAVSFGCTGGQHRSVYAAEKMAEYLRNNYPVTVVLQHIEQDKK